MCTILLWGCQSPAPAAGDPRGQAAQEATAIIQQAQATALMLQAQAQATAMVAQAAAILQAAQSAQPAALQPTRDAQAQATPAAPESTSITAPAASSSQPVSQTVEIHSVAFAADTGFIMVNYLAPPSISANFYQGTVTVLNELSGDLYSEVVVVPVIGPLVSRPSEAGQIGYVMLVNNAPGLKPGDIVTVKLGDYTFEHIQTIAQ